MKSPAHPNFKGIWRSDHKAIREAKVLRPQQGKGFLCEVAAMLRAAVALQEQKALLN